MATRHSNILYFSYFHFYKIHNYPSIPVVKLIIFENVVPSNKSKASCRSKKVGTKFPAVTWFCTTTSSCIFAAICIHLPSFSTIFLITYFIIYFLIRNFYHNFGSTNKRTQGTKFFTNCGSVLLDSIII